MGYDIVEFSGWARVSRHNSADDNRDNERWNEFVRRLECLAREYHDINLHIMAAPITGYPDYTSFAEAHLRSDEWR